MWQDKSVGAGTTTTLQRNESSAFFFIESVVELCRLGWGVPNFYQPVKQQAQTSLRQSNTANDHQPCKCAVVACNRDAILFSRRHRSEKILNSTSETPPKSSYC
ncbi:conserved hypothetical protein [Trichinella spiralis]|uniref:hypothetical protein n=1 Tax=Trichinella spiralis TaxID=6334 RepID=UPI0001EFE561|nr:conserved hypothetical protein [Trichinella spiralis]